MYGWGDFCMAFICSILPYTLPFLCLCFGNAIPTFLYILENVSYTCHILQSNAGLECAVMVYIVFVLSTSYAVANA